MVKQSILIVYKNGSTINLDVPENYYQKNYLNKSDKKIHKKFINDYKKFVTALNKNKTVIDVNKYLPFSNASISGKDIISVDIKDQAICETVDPVTTFVPGVHDQVYLNIEGSDLENILKQLAETHLIEKFSNLIDKLYSYVSKSNVEFTIKTAKKTAAPRKKKITETPSVVSDDKSEA